MLPAGALRISIEEKYGALPHFVLYALLEWVVIILLFVDGLLAFVSNEIARLFELKTPCLLCTRLDHLLVRTSSSFYYNESICEVHKKDLSSLAYCHVHKRLSDVRTMCQGCLVSSERDCDRDHKHKSPLLEDERGLQLKKLKVERERIGMLMRWCSCCGEPTKSRYDRSSSSLSVAATASPRASWFLSSNDEAGDVDFQSSRYTELKLRASTDSELHGIGGEVIAHSHVSGREEMIEELPRTPTFASSNKFFGSSLTDAVAAPPPPAPLSPVKKSLEKTDLMVEATADEVPGEGDQADIVARLKKQVTHDRRSLMALYMELDEERSASAVAANNAMAMITRLQAEKAAVQMEASQYKRMMEEQAEYDQEAMQMMKNMLLKREEEMQDLERELEEYKERFGVIRRYGSEVCEVDFDEDNYQDIINSQALLSSSDQDEINVECRGDEFAMDYERERSRLVGMMRELVEGRVGGEGDEAGVSLIRGRLKAVEAESGFLKHAAMTLQRGGEGMKILSEIAEYLREVRQNRFENLESCSSSS